MCVCVRERERGDVRVLACVRVRAYLFQGGVSSPKLEEDDVDMFA